MHIANTGDVLIKGDLSAQGSSIIYLDSGNYWLDSLKLSGSSKIIINGNGEVNFYVKDNVDVSISNQVGSPSQKVNIFHYDDDQVKLGSSATWYGNVKSYGDFELQGSSKLYGAVQAKSLELSGSTRLYLDAGTYWYEEVDLQGSARVIPHGDELTTFYIEEDLELQGSTELGTSENPVLAFVYGDGDDDGEAELEGSSKIYGYVYVEGELEMQGSTNIFGAVNVVDLEMEGSASINYSAIPVSGEVHHYKLSFDIEANHLTAYACGDEACSEALLYSRPAMLHIKDGLNNNSISNFNNFLKSDKDTNPNTKLDKNKCIQFVDKKADPKPETSPGLRCYLSDGTRLQNCKLCTEQDVQSSLAAHVYDEITLNEEVLGETAPNFDFYIAELNGTGTLKTGNKILKEGSAVSFPLDLTYNKAEAISLTIKGDNGKNGKNKLEVEYQLELVFVPKQLRWSAADCGGKDGFIYADHAASCTVLGKAGEHAGLTLQAYGAGNKRIDDYSAQLKEIVIRELTADAKVKDDSPIIKQPAVNFNQSNKPSFTSDKSISTVGLIQAMVPDSCAPYAISDSGCMLETDGDTAIIGRTVPASLKVVETQSGDIKDGVVYAGKPGVSFDVAPSLTVIGLDAKGKELPSFSGEFAGGLKGNSSIALNSDIALKGLVPTFDEPEAGKHVISCDTDKLEFIKDKRFPETALNLPIQLAIENHDDTQGVNGATTPLAKESDTLRFGFVTLMDAEIKVDEEGTMASKLNYFGKDVQTVLEDNVTDYELEQATRVTHKPMLDPELLTLAMQEIKVTGYGEQQKGIQVTIDGLPDWLRPVDKDGSLTNPSAMLDILNNFRLRANDSIFNRREVVR
ncbi:hypothetical protein GCM10011502_29010 [Oceanisphaera marina]|uniref:Uncharacterized protein n=1 Tax=Oceanisphaera marina TaxID=2017550 RepID=A0ABQ1IW61_9GAMM|nr:hypothetical protein GCM10011502_29010 [Oceanisphaera marina]